MSSTQPHYLLPAKRQLLPLVSDPVTVVALKKAVAFNEVVKAKRTIFIADFNAVELGSYWYDSNELTSMKNDVRFQAKLLEQGGLFQTKSHIGGARYCYRGLEMFTPAGARYRSETRRKGQELVLVEQNLQREEGSDDPEYIAEIYASAANEARLAAIKAAHC